jgi:hypothetical protein
MPAYSDDTRLLSKLRSLQLPQIHLDRLPLSLRRRALQLDVEIHERLGLLGRRSGLVFLRRLLKTELFNLTTGSACLSSMARIERKADLCRPVTSSRNCAEVVSRS